jgi:hypothetical protein
MKELNEVSLTEDVVTEWLTVDEYPPEVVAALIQAVALKSFENTIKEAFGVDKFGKPYLEYICMALGGESREGGSAPSAPLTLSISELADAVREARG